MKNTCVNCGKPFRVSPSTILRAGGRGKFCSRDCRHAAKTVERKCAQCGASFTADMSRVKHGRARYCSSACRSKGHSYLMRGPRNPLWRGGDTKEKRRISNLKHAYGISLEDYKSMLEAQGGACAICKRPQKDKRGFPLHVDHDHGSEAVRGLLCNGCNRLIGCLESHLRPQAEGYLRKHAMPGNKTKPA